MRLRKHYLSTLTVRQKQWETLYVGFAVRPIAHFYMCNCSEFKSIPYYGKITQDNSQTAVITSIPCHFNPSLFLPPSLKGQVSIVFI